MYNFITFDINDHTIGVDMLKVDRIMKLGEISSIPNSSEYLEGVIEVENSLIPVINLKKVFNFPSKDVLPDSSIIVLSNQNEKYGIIVDCANDINEVSEDKILKTQGSKYVYGVAKVDDTIIKLLNSESLIKD